NHVERNITAVYDRHSYDPREARGVRLVGHQATSDSRQQGHLESAAVRPMTEARRISSPHIIFCADVPMWGLRIANEPVDAVGAVDAPTRPPLLGKPQTGFPQASTGRIL